MTLQNLKLISWETADNLRANSKLTSSDYFMPVLGLIFLRHAANRFDAATKQIADDHAAGRMLKRKLRAARDLLLPRLMSGEIEVQDL